ncbi:MAG: sigma 54-interacting transcriptional regulator [Deltaproteobacteria bacterium]|nr:sigma 54-interacting transcriptional regulator [Deltaproteobacteria bacterium]
MSGRDPGSGPPRRGIDLLTETLTVASRLPRPVVATVHVEVLAGPDAGRSFEVADRLVIGTHESSTVLLTDRTVSRFHCEIVRDDERLLIRDLGSRNGTFLEGVQVREAYCTPGLGIVLGETRLVVQVTNHETPVDTSTRDRFGFMNGRSAAMRQVFATLERVAPTDATVLLLGETGTGKEVAAESIHRESTRARGPFVVVDCGAIPSELLESELFGHDRGAFTGAIRTREGAFVAASGGTIFLDEIGELPKDLQPKLLRALSRRAIKPVGREGYIDIDVRVIAATNRDLRQEVNADRFRGDLYYRLAVVEVQLPSLRQRLDDLPVLVEAILDDVRARPGDRSRILAAAFLDHLRQHAWPGNIRELRNAIERALALRPWELAPVPEAPIEPASAPVRGDLAPAVDLTRPFKEARDEWTGTFERAYLGALLDAHGGNIRAAAKAAGIDRVHLYRLLARHGLRRADTES